MNPSRIPLGILILAITAFGCERVDSAGGAEEAADRQKVLMRDVYRAFETGDTAVIDSVIAEDFVEHEELPGLGTGREAVKEFIAQWRAAFPDFNIEVHRVVSEGDVAIAHVTFRGTHQGEFFGLAPTGRQIAVPTVDIIRFEDGVAAEHWGVTNEAVLLRQLGVIPEEETPAAEPSGTAPADTTR